MRKSSAKKAPGARRAQEEEILVFHVSLLVLFCIPQKNAKSDPCTTGCCDPIDFIQLIRKIFYLLWLLYTPKNDQKNDACSQ